MRLKLFSEFSRSNRKFTELFKKDLKRLSNNMTLEKILKKTEEIVRLGWAPLFKMKRVETESKCLDNFEGTAHAGVELFLALERLIKDNGHSTGSRDDYKPSTDKAVENLRKLMDRIKTVDDRQTFAFDSEAANDIYWFKRIAVLRDFKHLNEGDLGAPQIIGSDTNGILIYDQYLPFNNRLHTDEGCVPASKLPLFYKSKGKDQDDDVEEDQDGEASED